MTDCCFISIYLMVSIFYFENQGGYITVGSRVQAVNAKSRVVLLDLS